MIIWDNVGFPSSEQFIFEVIDHITVDIAVPRVLPSHIWVFSSTGSSFMLWSCPILLRLSGDPRSSYTGIYAGTCSLSCSIHGGSFRLRLFSGSESTWLHHSIRVTILVMNTFKVLLLSSEIGNPCFVPPRLLWWFHFFTLMYDKF